MIKRSLGIFAMVTSSLIAVSCGKKDGDNTNQNGAGSQLTQASLVDTWDGTYQPLDTDKKPMGPPSNVRATFADNGNFVIEFLQDRTAVLRGTWAEFTQNQQQGLYLNIDPTSSVAGFYSGVVSYTLIGKRLYIVSSQANIVLDRHIDTNPGGSNGSPGVGNETLSGHWHCEQGGYHSELIIEENYHWRATISQTSHRMMALQGDGASSGAQSVRLTVQTSSETIAPGSFMDLSVNGTTAILNASSANGNISSLGTCRKI